MNWLLLRDISTIRGDEADVVYHEHCGECEREVHEGDGLKEGISG